MRGCEGEIRKGRKSSAISLVSDGEWRERGEEREGTHPKEKRTNKRGNRKSREK